MNGIAAIITNGIGPGTAIKLVLTEGYASGNAPPPSTNTTEFIYYKIHRGRR